MSVPEFILKKMIVPDSFKSSANSFSFKIMNSFAAATISKFCILIGNTTVPAEDVLISSEKTTSITGVEITPDKPLILPVGLEILINVNASRENQPVRVVAMTREVGEISFLLNAGKSTHKLREMRPPILARIHPPKKASVRLDLHAPITPASPFILGQFVEHLERCVYDGVWTHDGRTLRPDTLDLIKQLAPPLIRYPGGNFASGYHWEDGIGPREHRPPRHDAAWQSEESNQVGTDEFLVFCEENGIVPLLVVNDGSGTPEEAACWVAYCNSPVTTEQGSHRASNGHPEPYRVQYWGIGNEVWGPWQIGTTSAEEYCRRAERFIAAMKAVDPSIKIVAVGHSPLTDEPDDEGFLWNEPVLKNLGKQIDYLSWHIYQPDKSGWQEVYDAEELYYAVCAAHLDIEKIIQRVKDQIIKAGANEVLQAIDEWNLWLPPREKNVSMHHVTYTMRDALYAAAVLMTFYKHGDTVGMANLAQLVNVLPLIETNAESAIATSLFYPFVLFRQMQPDVLPVEISAETFNSREHAINLKAHESVPFIDVLATINADKSILTLLVINRYPFSRVDTEIFLAGATALSPAHALQITAPSPDSYNNFEKPNRVRITDAPLPEIKDGKLRAQLKPCSIYHIELNLK